MTGGICENRSKLSCCSSFTFIYFTVMLISVIIITAVKYWVTHKG